jgi:hypothetical protein
VTNEVPYVPPVAQPKKKKEEYKPIVIKKKSLYTILTKLIQNLKPYYFISVFIIRKDQWGFFLWPVDTSVVQDYLSIVKFPMDLSTMERKVYNREYKTAEEFKTDFELIIDNAKKYNSPDTIYYKAAEKLSQVGIRMIERDFMYIDESLPDDPSVSMPPPQQPPTNNNQSTAITTRTSTRTASLPVEMNRQFTERSVDPPPKKKNPRAKVRETLEALRASQCHPDGSIIAENDQVWQKVGFKNAYEKHLNIYNIQYYRTGQITDISILKRIISY